MLQDYISNYVNKPNTVVIYTVGTNGDVIPLLNIASILIDNKYDVIFITHWDH